MKSSLVKNPRILRREMERLLLGTKSPNGPWNTRGKDWKNMPIPVSISSDLFLGTMKRMFE